MITSTLGRFFLAFMLAASVASCSSSSSGGGSGGGATDGGTDLGNDSGSDIDDGGMGDAQSDVAPDSTDDTGDAGDDSPVNGVSGEIVWDFEDGTLQGFVAVANDVERGMGVNNTISHGDSGVQGGGYGLEPLDFNAYRDSHHDLVLFRSQAFWLDGSQDIAAWVSGGVGDGSQPTDPDALAPSTDAAGAHPLGIAVWRASDGVYLAVGSRSELGEGEFVNITIPSSALTEAHQELVHIDVFDAFGGEPWSWMVVDDIRVHGWRDSGGCESSPCADDVECSEQPRTYPGFACGECPFGTAGDGVICSVVEGCDDSPCADGVTCTNRPDETPNFECGDCPEGTAGDGVTCTSVGSCGDSPCADEVSCTDRPGEVPNFECGDCPDGTAGNGITCTPTVCTPLCDAWLDCVAGECRTRTCANSGQCSGGLCFQGACEASAVCEERCATVYGAGPTWTCGSGGYCTINNCSLASVDCADGQDCVSDSSGNSRGPGGSGVFDKTCVSAGSSPCGGTCDTLCSASSGACF